MIFGCRIKQQRQQRNHAVVGASGAPQCHQPNLRLFPGILEYELAIRLEPGDVENTGCRLALAVQKMPLMQCAMLLAQLDETCDESS